MTQVSKNYARVLYELGISMEAIETAKELSDIEELITVLGSPVVAKKSKHNIVTKVFPEEMHNFMKLLCDYGSAGYLGEIIEAYEKYKLDMEDCVVAELICVEAPNDEQKEKIEQFLMGEYGKSKVRLNISKDDTLIAGFVLKAYDREYDWSLKGRISQLTDYLKNM